MLAPERRQQFGRGPFQVAHRARYDSLSAGDSKRLDHAEGALVVQTADLVQCGINVVQECSTLTHEMDHSGLQRVH